jgi:hypothetical protein
MEHNKIECPFANLERGNENLLLLAAINEVSSKICPVSFTTTLSESVCPFKASIKLDFLLFVYPNGSI